MDLRSALLSSLLDGRLDFEIDKVSASSSCEDLCSNSLGSVGSTASGFENGVRAALLQSFSDGSLESALADFQETLREADLKQQVRADAAEDLDTIDHTVDDAVDNAVDDAVDNAVDDAV